MISKKMQRMRKKLDNIFQKAFKNGILPKGFSWQDFDTLCRCFYDIQNSGYAETINKTVADYFVKQYFKIIDWSEPQYEAEHKIGYRIME